MILLKLKLKALGLAALLFCVFTSCDQLLPTAGSGVDIPVKIRAVSVSGGDQTEITTRASGESERRIIGEPIVQDLGDGLFAEISVEEDVSALRANLSLAKDVKLRIIALNKGTSIIYSWADYTATTSGEFSKVAGNLHVVSDVEYDFVCFSYNSTTANLPAAPSEGGSLGSIAVTNANDFLYKKWTTSLSATSNTLSFTLEQQLTKVNLTFAVSYSDWKITKVNSSPKIGKAVNPSAFAHGTNVLSGSDGDQTFTGLPATPNAIQASSEYLRIAPAEASTVSLTIPKQAVTLSGTSLTVTSHPTSARKATVSSKLEKGRSYTLTVKIKVFTASNKFAGSNIYWNGKELTFDEHGSNGNTKYQGVFFKWGSLIGISPAQTNGSDGFSSGTTASSGQTDGTPIYLKVNGEWKKTNVTYATTQGWFGSGAVAANTTGGDAWKVILSYEEFDSNLYGEGVPTLPAMGSGDYSAYKGDICKYLKSTYRMPTLTELKALGTGDTNASGPYKWTDSGSVPTTPTADGKVAFTTQFGTFTGISGSTYYLPTSGCRYHGSGKLVDVSSRGSYWSSSAYSGSDDNAYRLGFYISNASTGNYSRSYGMSVRCVKN